MKQNSILWGLALGTFVVTLGISSWHDGLWQSDSDPASDRRPGPAVPAVAPTPTRPFAPAIVATASPAEPVTTPPFTLAAAAPSTPKVEEEPEAAPEVLTHSEPQSEPSTTPDVDNGEMLARRERAAAHSARAH